MLDKRPLHLQPVRHAQSHMKSARLSCLVFSMAAAAFPCAAGAEPPPLKSQGKTAVSATAAQPAVVDALIARLDAAPVVLTSPTGHLLGQRANPESAYQAVREDDIIRALTGAHLTARQAAELWEFFAEEDNAPLATLPIVKALIAASDTPLARESMWAELAGTAREFAPDTRPRSRVRSLRAGRLDRRRAGQTQSALSMRNAAAKAATRTKSLVGFFERHSGSLLAALYTLPETEPSSSVMLQLMQTTRVFGASLEQSVAWTTGRIPGTVARFIEHERGDGRQVAWNQTAASAMIRWKASRFSQFGQQTPHTLAEYDANNATYMAMLNALQGYDSGLRAGLLQDFGPLELLNAAIGGEQDLYRTGTTGYRDIVHPAILRGIAEAGSFEAYLDRALPRRFGDDANRAAPQREMAVLRIAAYFGHLSELLERVQDPGRMVTALITALEDPRTFEANNTVITDLLTSAPTSETVRSIKQALNERLYAKYRAAKNLPRNMLGSALAVYQALSGDRRDTSIERDFMLDQQIFDIPFDQVFSPAGSGGYVHRMFMRMDADDDARGTYEAFNTMMKSMDAAVRRETHFDVFTLTASGRTIEIYANAPSPAGLKQGIPAIAQALKGLRVETVIGRGHTAIIGPMQQDAKLVLGRDIKNVAAVIVGSCGGDAAVRELIGTFGYRPFITTRSTGRRVINNAIIKTYMTSLLSMPDGARLPMNDVVSRATARFQRDGIDEDLRADAALYQANQEAVFTAYAYDHYVRRDVSTRAAAATVR